jgi:hypothetical protein
MPQPFDTTAPVPATSDPTFLSTVGLAPMCASPSEARVKSLCPPEDAAYYSSH